MTIDEVTLNRPKNASNAKRHGCTTVATVEHCIKVQELQQMVEDGRSGVRDRASTSSRLSACVSHRCE